MRMIDAENQNLQEAIGRMAFQTRQDIYDLIATQPTVDAVQVVRCEDCAFSQSDGWVCCGTALMPQHRTFPDSFCSNGERKDKANES